jgi:hypothetical protein
MAERRVVGLRARNGVESPFKVFRPLTGEHDAIDAEARDFVARQPLYFHGRLAGQTCFDCGFVLLAQCTFAVLLALLLDDGARRRCTLCPSLERTADRRQKKFERAGPECFAARRTAAVGHAQQRGRTAIVLLAASESADFQLLGAQESGRLLSKVYERRHQKAGPDLSKNAAEISLRNRHRRTTSSAAASWQSSPGAHAKPSARPARCSWSRSSRRRSCRPHRS